MTGPDQLTVRGLLAADLAPSRRMQHLQELCGHFTPQPLDATVTGLRDALTDPIDVEAYRRLHILISHLYHQCGASIPCTEKLRADVNAAFRRRGEPARTTPEGR